MPSIFLPQPPKVLLEEANRAVIVIEGLYPGYGLTIGNALRRVLLSSLPGAAVTSFTIKGVSHDFSTMPGVIEDVVEISLNLKRLRFRMFGEDSQKLTLSVKGERVVKAKDLAKNSQVEVVNPDQLIATLTSKNAELQMELQVEKGIGYSQVEARKKEKLPIGMIAIDAMFSPVRKVNFEIENMRVGDRTDFNRLKLHIETDGTTAPIEAILRSAEILMEHFDLVKTLSSEREALEREGFSKLASDEVMKTAVEGLGLSTRAINALKKGGIKTLGGLAKQRFSQLSKLEGLGAKGLEEIKKVVAKYGLTLKE